MKKLKKKKTKQSTHNDVECDICGHVVPATDVAVRYNAPICETCLVEIVEPITIESVPGRNEACSCGSGKKYKRCCGKT